jgi:hypothetical protein
VTGDDRPRRPRRPGLIARAIHWRIELAIAASTGLLAHFTGPTFVCLLATAAIAVVATVPVIRQATVRAFHLIALPHRVRTALAQAGAVDLDGRLPWVLWARSAGPNVVRVEVQLRAGVTFADLYDAIPNVGTACATLDARVFQRVCRCDRASVFLVKPRWGLWR